MVAYSIYQAHVMYVTFKIALNIQVNVSNKPCRATRKTTLNCMPALSICLVPNVHCKHSQQLRTICTCVTDYTNKCV